MQSYAGWSVFSWHFLKLFTHYSDVNDIKRLVNPGFAIEALLVLSRFLLVMAKIPPKRSWSVLELRLFRIRRYGYLIPSGAIVEHPGYDKL